MLEVSGRLGASSPRQLRKLCTGRRRSGRWRSSRSCLFGPGRSLAGDPDAGSADAPRRPRYRVRREARAGSAGFTLLELMVVLVILGLLAGLVGPRLFGKVDSSKVQVAQTQIRMLRGALQAYRLDIGRYPSTAEGLTALMRPPPEAAAYWSGPYLDDEMPLDPWRTPYRYEHPADNLQGFALYSLGADSADGGEGVDADIGYLPEQT